MRETTTEHKQELRCLETYKYTKTNGTECVFLSLQGHIKDSRL